jgi:hypothetical protein
MRPYKLDEDRPGCPSNSARLVSVTLYSTFSESGSDDPVATTKPTIYRPRR